MLLNFLLCFFVDACPIGSWWRCGFAQSAMTEALNDDLERSCVLVSKQRESMSFTDVVCITRDHFNSLNSLKPLSVHDYLVTQDYSLELLDSMRLLFNLFDQLVQLNNRKDYCELYLLTLDRVLAVKNGALSSTVAGMTKLNKKNRSYSQLEGDVAEFLQRTFCSEIQLSHDKLNKIVSDLCVALQPVVQARERSVIQYLLSLFKPSEAKITGSCPGVQLAVNWTTKN